MDVDGRNPAFPRAIPHGTVIIDSLLEVVLFGVSPGCPRAVSRGGFQTPSGGTFPRGVCEHSESFFLRSEPDPELGAHTIET